LRDARRLVLAASVALTGCSGGRDLLVPVTDTVFHYEQEFSGLARLRVFTADFSVPTSGTLHIAVDWSSPADDLDLVLSNPACDAVTFAAGACKIFAIEQSNLKPAQLSLPTTATGYRLFVVNRGPSEETGKVVVTVTQTHLAL
jgi:hypothetical protein